MFLYFYIFIFLNIKKKKKSKKFRKIIKCSSFNFKRK